MEKKWVNKLTFHKAGHFFQLGDFIRLEHPFIFQKLENSAIFSTCMFRHQIKDHVVNSSPSAVFSFSVLDVWEWLSTNK